MKLYLLTQEDAFYIPKLLTRFLSRLPSGCTLVGAAILRGEIRRENALRYLQLLGPSAFLQNGLLYAGYRVMDTIDARRPLGGVYSVEGALRKKGIPIDRPADINTPTFRRHLEELGVDLLISIACPQVVRRELLSLPPKGCINLHGALLPRYRGKMPSFWVLAKGERETGVTVHYMNEKLDDGPILVQRTVPIDPQDTLHSLVMKSKVNYGADALAEAVRKIADGSATPLANDPARASYFSFPTPDAVREFRRRGRRFR